MTAGSVAKGLGRNETKLSIRGVAGKVSAHALPSRNAETTPRQQANSLSFLIKQSS
jgi:hypothetical protein